MHLANPDNPSAASTLAENAEEEIRQERSEEDLLAAYVEGDESAFEELLARVGGMLYVFIRRMMGEDTRAEDVYQDVLIKIATRAHYYHSHSKLKPWLFQIARNACIDSLRRESRRTVVSLDSIDEDQITPGVGKHPPGKQEAPDAKVMREELSAAILRVVQALPDEQREVFLLKEEGGLTFRQISRILGCEKETAKSRMRYALERLRNALGREARNYGL
ncbi:MAG: sigma-70 family RNA polymerase sigma factor [Planctomycetes bacterium]|nr:sigma-70 family RNA polymerase sigma factor [Planctomycetota bacterium]